MLRAGLARLRRVLPEGRRTRAARERIAGCEMFDEAWYLARNPDVAAAGQDAAQHYLTRGALEGRDPGPSFSTAGYVKRYPDVAASGLNPLLHYIRHGAGEGRAAGPLDDEADLALISSTDLFDADWYLAEYSDVLAANTDPARHYLAFGASEGRNPGPRFDGSRYLARHTDVRRAHLNPLLHYLRHGRDEGRAIPPPSDALDAQALAACGLFDAKWYAAHYPDVAEAGIEPDEHYWLFGAEEGRQPGPGFDPYYYLGAYADVAASGGDPLRHFVLYGAAEGRCPAPPDTKIGFMHIAKTGGSTVNAAFAKVFPNLTIFHAEGLRNWKRTDGAAFVSAHFAYPVLMKRVRPDFAFTFLREPVAHLRSHLAWARDNAPLEGLRDVDLDDAASVRDCLNAHREDRTFRILFENCQTRYMLTPNMHRPLRSDDYRAAVDTLMALDFVGITEKFDASMDRLFQMVGRAPYASLEARNTGSYTKSIDVAAFRRELWEFIRFDCALYELAEARLKSRLAARLCGARQMMRLALFGAPRGI